MIKYSVKRLLQSLVTIFLVVSITFLLIRLMPESGYFDAATWMKASPAVKMNLLQSVGVRDANGNKINAFVQLFNFYKKLITSGDFGTSYRLWVGQPVTRIVSEKAPYSIGFGLIATVFSLLLGYSLGVVMARFKDRLVDRLGMIYIVLISAAPAVVYLHLMQFYLTKWLHSPMLFNKTNTLTWVSPLIIMVATGLTGRALWIRRYMVDQLNADYVKLCYAKGLPGRRVMFRHVLRNAIVPMCYGLPGAFLWTIGGSILIENLFAIPGMGSLLIKAVQERENNLVQLICIIYAVLGVISVFLGDLLAAAVDPRIRLTDRGGKSR